MGCFFLAPGGLAGHGSHEGSRSCVLQQSVAPWQQQVKGMGEGGVGHNPCSEHWVGSSVPAGVNFPEEQRHIMFLELRLQGILGNDSLLAWE